MLRIDGKKSADGTTMRKSKLMSKDRKKTSVRSWSSTRC